MKYVRLKNPDGIFVDRPGNFQIFGGEVKPLPRILGNLTREFLQGGGLVVVKDEKKVASQPEAVKSETAPIEDEPEAADEPEMDPLTQRIKELEDAYTVPELRDMAKRLGVRIAPNAKEHRIATQIARAEMGLEQE